MSTNVGVNCRGGVSLSLKINVDVVIVGDGDLDVPQMKRCLYTPSASQCSAPSLAGTATLLSVPDISPNRGISFAQGRQTRGRKVDVEIVGDGFPVPIKIGADARRVVESPTPTDVAETLYINRRAWRSR